MNARTLAVLPPIGRPFGEYQRAIEDLDEAIRLDPQAAIAYNNRSAAYRPLGEYQRAITDYDVAISSELGMRPLMERVLSRRDILKA